MSSKREPLRSTGLAGDSGDPQGSPDIEYEPSGDLPLMRGGYVQDPLGVVHLIATAAHDIEGDPMFIGTTCWPTSGLIGKRGKGSQGPPTCLACVLGRENANYTKNLIETIDNVAFIKRATGGTQMVKDRIALDKLTERLKNPPKQIDNSSLHAGSPMHFYCKLCADVFIVRSMEG